MLLATRDHASHTHPAVPAGWRRGYSCYRFSECHRRNRVRLALDETSGAIYVMTESATIDREPKFLWWGGQERGWLEGHDAEFQSAITSKFEYRIETWYGANVPRTSSRLKPPTELKAPFPIRSAGNHERKEPDVP